MSAARHDEREQEISIRQREHELFRGQDESTAPTRPFAEYLRETPSAPLPTWVQAILWTLAVVVALLFIASLWRMFHKGKARMPRKPPHASTSPALQRAPFAVTALRSPHSTSLPTSPNLESPRS